LKNGRLFTLLTLYTTITLLWGCGPKTVAPYATPSDSTITEGRDFEYPVHDYPTITEEISPSVETLDTSTNPITDPTTTFSMAADQQSDEYKKSHGRTSPQLHVIYFDFDQATIRADQIADLEFNAAYLKNNPFTNVIIEGNCDERGTNEYNLALGERRALNAKNYLIQLGIQPHRVRTRTLGEERPLFPGTDELSYGYNRRDDFLIE